jgi:hypothetical protein
VTARDCDVTSSVRLPSYPVGLDAERASMLSLSPDREGNTREH